MEAPLLAELNDEWVVHLLSVSACRRLSGDEVRHILLSVDLPGDRIPLKRLVVDAPPPVKNGTIVLARKGLVKCVKKDGGNWTKRPNGNKVREDHVKIMCTNNTGYAATTYMPPTMINCYISRMGASNRTSGKGMLCRRRYVMELTPYSVPQKSIFVNKGSLFQLIHYLSDKEAIDAAALAVAASPPGVYPLQLPLVGGRSNEMVEIEGLEPISTSAAVGQWHNSIEVNSTPHHHGTSSSLSDTNLASYFCHLDEISVPPEVTVLDISPGWDFTFGGAKVLICLSQALPLNAFPCSGTDCIGISALFGSKNAVPCELLGSQVLRCYSPPSCLQSGVGKVPLKVYIGHTDISQNSIFFEYRNVAGLAFGMVHQHLTCTSSLSSSNSCQKYNKRQQGDDSRISKIRVVERLGAFAQTQTSNQVIAPLDLCPQNSYGSDDATTSCARTVDNNVEAEQKADNSCKCMGTDGHVFASEPPPSCGSSMTGGHPVHSSREGFADVLDDSALSELDDSQLEGLLNQIVVRVIGQLAQIASTCGNLSDELGKQDSVGFALLHYACICGNLQLVPRLIACGTDPMQRTGDDAVQTPLHLAAAAGHIKLLDAGARPDARDAQGLTPSDVAFRKGHKDMGQWLENLQQIAELQHDSPILETPRRAAACSEHHVHQIPGERLPSSLPPTDAVVPPSSSATAKFPSSRILRPKHYHHSLEKSRSCENLKTSQLLQNSFSSLSLHEKCAVCLSLPKNSEHRSSSPTGKELCYGSATLQEVFSETERNSLGVAMSVMGADELGNLEKQARIIQQNVRAWALRRNYTNMRNAVLTLQMFWRNRRSGRTQKLLQQAQQQQQLERNAVDINDQSLDLEDVGGGEELLPVYLSNLSQHIAATTQLQAAARGMLTRRQFARLKSEATTLLKLR